MEDTIDITFENTRQDILHGCRYVRNTSPLHRKLNRIGYFFLFLVAVFLGVTGRDEDDGIAYTIGITLILFGFMFAFAWVFIYLWNEYALRKSMPKNDASGILGEHHLTITPEYVIERTHVDETKFLWKSVPRIDEDDKYIYLFQTPNAAHLIPKRIFGDPEKSAAFISKLKEFRNLRQ